MENYRQIKRVSFKSVEKDLEEEVIEKVKELISVKVREEWNRKFKELEEKVTKIEKEIEEQREERRKKEEEYGGWDDWRGSEEVEPRAGQKRGVITGQVLG